MLTIDISENKVLGPAYNRGRLEGLEEGRQDGQLGLLVRLPGAPTLDELFR